ARERQEDVHEPSDRQVEAAPEVAGHQAEEAAHRRGQADGHETNAQADATAVPDPRQGVTPQLVGAERVLEAGRLTDAVEIPVDARVVRGEDGREEGRTHDADHDHEAGAARRATDDTPQPRGAPPDPPAAGSPRA